MTHFLESFTIPKTAPELMGGIGQGGMADVFAKRFGTRFKKTPVKGVWYLGDDDDQITIRMVSDGRIDLAYYQETSLSEFKSLFGKTYLDACYRVHDMSQSKYKYWYLQIIEDLKEQGRWGFVLL